MNHQINMKTLTLRPILKSLLESLLEDIIEYPIDVQMKRFGKPGEVAYASFYALKNPGISPW